MATCSVGQLPYRVSSPGGQNFDAVSPHGACYQYSASISNQGWDWVEYGQGHCMVQNTSSGLISVSRVSQICKAGTPHFADPDYTNSPFAMSVTDGATLSGLIIGVWVAAFVIRAAIRALGDHSDATT